MSFLTETYNQSDVVVYGFDTDSQLPFVKRRLGRPTLVNVFYSDVNSGFRQNKDDLIVTDDRAIDLQINNILSTPLRSDEFEPEFGSMLPYRLQDLIQSRTAYLLRNDTIEALRKWMGRHISLDLTKSSVRVIDDNPDYEGYLIDIRYQINKTGVVHQYSMAFVR